MVSLRANRRARVTLVFSLGFARDPAALCPVRWVGGVAAQGRIMTGRAQRLAGAVSLHSAPKNSALITWPPANSTATQATWPTAPSGGSSRCSTPRASNSSLAPSTAYSTALLNSSRPEPSSAPAAGGTATSVRQ